MICSEWSNPESLGNKNFRFHFRFFLALLIALIFMSHAFQKYKCLFFYTSFVSSYICPRSLRDSQAKILEMCACVCVCLHACVCVCLYTIFDYKKKKKKKKKKLCNCVVGSPYITRFPGGKNCIGVRQIIYRILTPRWQTDKRKQHLVL